MQASFKEKLARGDRLLGTIVTLPAPEVAEIMRLAGFDWLFVDLEHGPMGVRDAQTVLASVGDTPCILRVPANDAVWIKKCLDTGAAGIMVPQIRTARDAQTAVSRCKYPPRGERSVGISRAQGYGLTVAQHIARANDETAVILQIEHVDAVANIDAILAVPGIDALFVGPFDLSASMGKIGRVADPEVQKAISRVTAAAVEKRLPIGIFGVTADAVKAYMASGYTLIAVGIDTMVLATAAAAIVDALRA